jgi:hypothetical protein
MLVGVKVALKLCLIILKFRIKLAKSSVYKNCSKESNLDYLFNNLSSHMKGWQDNKAVRFGFELTSYFSRLSPVSSLLFFVVLTLCISTNTTIVSAIAVSSYYCVLVYFYPVLPTILVSAAYCLQPANLVSAVSVSYPLTLSRDFNW